MMKQLTRLAYVLILPLYADSTAATKWHPVIRATNKPARAQKPVNGTPSSKTAGIDVRIRIGKLCSTAAIMHNALHKEKPIRPFESPRTDNTPIFITNDTNNKWAQSASAYTRRKNKQRAAWRHKPCMQIILAFASVAGGMSHDTASMIAAAVTGIIGAVAAIRTWFVTCQMDTCKIMVCQWTTGRISPLSWQDCLHAFTPRTWASRPQTLSCQVVGLQLFRHSLSLGQSSGTHLWKKYVLSFCILGRRWLPFAPF